MILNLNKQVNRDEKPISQEEALEIIRRIEQKYGTFASLKPSDRKPLTPAVQDLRRRKR